MRNVFPVAGLRLGPGVRLAGSFAAAAVFVGALLTAGTSAAGGEEVFREVAGEVGLEFHHFIGSSGDYYLTEVVGPGVALFDYDGDGDLDVYFPQGRMLNPDKTLADAVFAPPKDHWPGNRLFRNELVPSGKLRFVDVTREAGLGDEGYGLGVAVADYDNDGEGNFDDVTSRYGLDFPSTAFTGFGTRWFDYDNDGRLDLFAANGSIMVADAQRGDPFPYREKNQLFRNQGEKFRDVSAESGDAFELEEVSRGAAFGDIDNDGDTDIVVANSNGAARLLLNLVGRRNGWLQVRLEGATVNRDAIGARVALSRTGRGDAKPVWRRVSTDGSYLSASDPRVLFGLGSAGEPEQGELTLTVVWPNGAKERWTPVEANTMVTLREGTGVAVEN